MIYLNNGATSWPKPPAVLEAVTAERTSGAGSEVYDKRDSDGRSPGNSSTTGQPCADREPLFQRDRLCAGYGDDPRICKETWTDPDRGCVAECWLYPC